MSIKTHSSFLRCWENEVRINGGTKAYDVFAIFVSRLLQNNNIKGRLPPELGALPRLQTLDLSNNRFSGHVPDTMDRLSALRFLCVSQPSPETSHPFSFPFSCSALVAHVLLRPAVLP